MNAHTFSFPSSTRNSRRPLRRRVCQRTRASVLLACVVLLLPHLLLPRRAEACGPDFLNALFVSEPRPEFPLDDFARGRIGVLQSTYARSYLVAAYRVLEGIAPDTKTQAALFALWSDRLGLKDTPWDAEYRERQKKRPKQETNEDDQLSDRTVISAWRDARARALPGGASEKTELASLYARNKNGYNYYLNCATDGIRTATRTLDERVRHYGASSPAVRDWVTAQDRVFSYCSSNIYQAQQITPQLPDEKLAVADETLRRDRAYQIAAALFYDSRYDEARERFRLVARDAGSPWRALGALLVARTLLRQATLEVRAKPAASAGEGAGSGAANTNANANSNAASVNNANANSSANASNTNVSPAENAQKEEEEPPFDQERLSEAADELKRILADDNLREVHPAATRLLNFARFKLEPLARLRELEREVLEPHEGAHADLQQSLYDYTFLLDKFLHEETATAQELRARKSADIPSELRPEGGAGDVTDWTLTFQTNDAPAREHAVARWRATHTPAWLIAALSKTKRADAERDALVNEAFALPRTSPAFLTAAYHALRLLIESGEASKRADARRRLDEILDGATTGNNKPSALTLSARNLFLGLRARTARDLDEYLRDAARKPAEVEYDYTQTPATALDESWSQPDAERDGRETSFVRGERYAFDDETATFLNTQFPLAVSVQAAHNGRLPAYLRRDIALAAWVRAGMLDEFTTGRELAMLARELAPELSEEVALYLNAPDASARRFAVIYTALRFPGLRPYVDNGIGRTTAFARIDNYRDNWWCALADFKGTTTAAERAGESSEDATDTTGKTPNNDDAPQFLSAAQRDAARDELKRLAAFDTAPNFLTQEVLNYAARHPDDARVPEALHYAVKSTRYGCTNKETGALSYRAFTLLKTRYKNTSWATQTKFWFKE